MSPSWVRKLFGPAPRPTPRPPGRRPLWVESLEDRTVPTFLATTTTPVGLNPHGIAVGDFNADGKADMAVANSSANTVSVLVSNGDGTFQPKADYPAGIAPFDATAADYNADGRIDLAVAGGSAAASTVTVLLGNGDGTFGGPTAFATGYGPRSVKSGDFNADGNPDLATTNGGTVSVLLGNGDGSFQAGTSTLIPGSSTRAVTADFNHDGKLDLATSNTVSQGTATVLLGKGDGSFQPAASHPMFSAPVDLVCDDFDGDGNDDLACPNSYASSSMTIIYGHGDGTFDPPQTDDIPQTGYEIEAGDYNEDGIEDVAVRGGSSYMVRLGRGGRTFYPTQSYAAPAGVFQQGTSGDFDGDGAADFAAPTGSGTVMVTMNAHDDRANVAAAVGFALTAAPTITANANLPVTVTAVDAAGNPVPGFRGTVYFGGSDPLLRATPYTFTAADAGAHTFATGVKLVTVGTQALTASAPFLAAASATVTVTPAATRFLVSAPATAAAGDALTVTVTAADAFGNPATGYLGTVTFGSTDVQAGLPPAYTFTAADAGAHAFTAALKTAGVKAVTATDAANGLYGSAAVSVTPGAAVGLAIAAPSGPIGVARPVTVTARDAYGNVATSYTGTVHFTTSDPAAVLPADTALVNGTATVWVTMMTVGSQTVTATGAANPAFTATATVADAPAVMVGFAVTGFPATTAGAARTFTVTAVNSIGQTATDYTGTVVFSSSDAQAGLPPSYTFTAADRGVHTFTATLKTAGSQSIRASDATNWSLAGSQDGIAVTPAAAAGMAVSGFPSTMAGVAQAFTVRVRDAYGNTVTGYAGTVKFTSTDAQATLPANYTFTVADAGTHTFAGTLRTAAGSQSSGGQTITAADTANSGLVGSQTNIQVSAAAATHFGLNVPSSVTAGTPFSLKVTALDDYGNKVNDYQGTVHFTSAAGAAGLPADYRFSPSLDNGVHTFTLTVSGTSLQTITVTDTLTSSVTGSVSFTPKSGGGGGGGSGGGGGGGGGGKKP